MTYSDFKIEIYEKISTRLPENYTSRIETISKNNGVNLDGLIIMNPDTNIYPTMYLNDYYDLHKSDGYSIDACVDRLLDSYDKYKLTTNVDVSCLQDFNSVKNNIIYRLVNRKKNHNFLKSIPWRPFLDLAIIYSIWIESKGDTHGTVTITNNHIHTWGCSENQLYTLAHENSKSNLPSVIFSLPDFLNDIAGEKVIEEADPSKSMFILTNKSKMHGAACVLYDNVLKEFARKYKKDLYILPSSIHEVILLVDSDELQHDSINDLVRDVNSTQVDIIEQLSDHAYKYIWKEDRIIF